MTYLGFLTGRLEHFKTPSICCRYKTAQRFIRRTRYDFNHLRLACKINVPSFDHSFQDVGSRLLDFRVVKSVKKMIVGLQD